MTSESSNLSGSVPSSKVKLASESHCQQPSCCSRFTWANFFRRKPVEKSLSEVTGERTLTLMDLTMYGVAATVGSGIYSIVGQVARGRKTLHDGSGPYIDPTGPAVMFSTLIAGGLAFLTSICYLEFASALPISGSGYAYFYALIGEFLGWFIGWNLTLEYAFCAAAIAGKWSEGLRAILKELNVFPRDSLLEKLLFNYNIYGDFRFSLVAPFLILFLGLIVGRGVSMGTRFTNAATILNLSLITFIIGVGWFYVKYENWEPFIAPVSAEIPVDKVLSPMTRIVSGAAEMFFCFIGYDTVSTLSADAINPARDIPLAAFFTIGTATTLYSLIGLILTGMKPWEKLIRTPVLAGAFSDSGAQTAAMVVNCISLLNMAVTVFACLMGQPKIFAAISRDGLLPRSLARENSRGVPKGSVWMTVLGTALLTAIYDVENGIIDVISAGCLFSMSGVCAGMLASRFNSAPRSLQRSGQLSTVAYFLLSLIAAWSLYYPGAWMSVKVVSLTAATLPFLHLVYLFWVSSNSACLLRPASASANTDSPVKSFVCPLMPLIPCLAIAVNNYVLASISATQIYLFVGWAVMGICIYCSYGLHHSVLGKELEELKSFGKF